MKKIYELHADICKIFANAKRLEIISSLKDRGVILTRREGTNSHYRIANPKIIQACNLMREVLLEQIERKESLPPSA